MQPDFVKEIIDIIVSVIIYLAAFALLTRELLARSKRHKQEVAAEIVGNVSETAAPAIPEEKDEVR